MNETPSGRIRIWVTGPFSLLNRAFEVLLGELPGCTLTVPAPGPTKTATQFADLILLVLASVEDLAPLYQLSGDFPGRRVLLLAPGWRLSDVRAALQAGAAGCLDLGMPLQDLAAGLRQAARGEIALSTSLQRALILEMAQEAVSQEPDIESLSDREREVLTWVCKGLSNKQIAQQLYLSIRTVENHLARLYGKLGVSSRTEAAVLSVQHGWIDLD